MANPKAYSVMYDSLPPPAAASSAPAAASSAGGATSAVASGGGGGNNKRPADSQSSSSASGSGGGLPEGWKRVPSRSRPGAFTYENQYTKERISWVPDRPASRKMKDLPPEPPRAPKPQRPSDPEEAKRESAEKLKIFLEKLQEYVASPSPFRTPIQPNRDAYVPASDFSHTHTHTHTRTTVLTHTHSHTHTHTLTLTSTHSHTDIWQPTKNTVRRASFCTNHCSHPLRSHNPKSATSTLKCCALRKQYQSDVTETPIDVISSTCSRLCRRSALHSPRSTTTSSTRGFFDP